MRQKIAKHPLITTTTVLVTILISVIALFSFQSKQNELKADDLDPGEVRFTKTAKPVDGEVNSWDVEVKVEAQNHYPPKPNDVIIVLDTSGSMRDVVAGGETRFQKAQEAAIEFANQILQADYENRIAIVRYSLDATVAQSFTDSAATVTSAVNTLANPTGGTFTQLGLNTAANLMASDSRDVDSQGRKVTRSIILISDGMATYSAKPTSGNWAYPILGGTEYMTRVGTSNVFETEHGMEAFDYTNVKGNGSSVRTNATAADGLPSLTTANVPTGVNASNVTRAYNHGNAAIAESKLIQARTKGSEDLVDQIYTIGLDLSVGTTSEERTYAEKSMEGIATNGHSYIIGIDDLSTVLDSIGTALVYIMQDTVITDPIAKGFVETGTVTNTNVTHGTVTTTTNSDGQTVITWDMGSSEAGATTDGYFVATLTYRVTLTEDILDPGVIGTDGLAVTNGETTIEYTSEGEDKEDEFEVPKVKPIIVSLEKILEDVDGNVSSDTTQEFDVEITGTGLSPTGNTFILKNDGNKTYIIRNWKSDTDYTVTELLDSIQAQEYGTHIDIRGVDTPGTAAIFNFGDDPDAFENHDIIVYNEELPEPIVKLHVRQVLVTTNGEIVQPGQGYYNSATTVGGVSYSFNSNSSITNSAPIDQALFTTYGLMLGDTDNILEVSGIIPEHYSLVGYVVTDDVANINNHVSSNAGLQTSSSVQLDFDGTGEYWVTFFVEADSASPGMNNWDYELNDFGTISVP